MRPLALAFCGLLALGLSVDSRSRGETLLGEAERSGDAPKPGGAAGAGTDGD